MSQNQSGQSPKQQQQQQKQHHQQQIQQYQQLVEQVKPKPAVLKNAFWAFVVGGLFSAIGQVILMFFMAQGLAEKPAASAMLLTMIFLGALLTGLGVYDEIGKVAGAGSIVPITGFANSIVAPALEFKREGYIFGVGARMFNIAGPVLVYGFITSVLIGLLAFLLKGGGP